MQRIAIIEGVLSMLTEKAFAQDGRPNNHMVGSAKHDLLEVEHGLDEYGQRQRA